MSRTGQGGARRFTLGWARRVATGVVVVAVTGALSGLVGSAAGADETPPSAPASLVYGMAHISPVYQAPGAPVGASLIPVNQAGSTRPTSFDLNATTILHSACINSDCPYSGAKLVYNGGALVTNPTVYLVRFSTSASELSPAGGFVDGVFNQSAPNGVGAARAVVGPDGAWWRGLYSVAGQTLNAGAVGGVVTLTNAELASELVVSDSQIQTGLSQAISSGALPGGAGAIYVVVLRSGQISYLGVPGVNSLNTYCGYHSAGETGSGANFTYAVLPYESSNIGCMSGAVSNNGASSVTGASESNGVGTNGVGLESDFDDFTTIMSHEIVETITDPFQSGWFSAGDQSTGGAQLEVADLCAQGPGSGAVVSSGGVNYSVQYEYSNTVGGCLGGAYPASLVGSYSNGTMNFNLAGADQGVAGVELAVSINGVTSTIETSTNGSASISASPGSVVSASVTGSSGVLANKFSGVAGASSGSITGAISAGSTPTSALELQGSVSGASGGSVDAFGPYGQLVGSGPVESSGAFSVGLTGVVSNDTVSVVYEGPVAVGAYSLIVPQTAKVTVQAPAVSLAGEPYIMSVTVSPAEGNATVIVFNGSNYLQAKTGPNGVATLSFTDSMSGVNDFGVYVLGAHNDLSTFANVDFQSAVTAQLAVNANSISGTLGYGMGASLGDAKIDLTVGAKKSTVTTDASGNFNLNYGAKPGTLVGISWEGNTYIMGGAVYQFAPGASGASVASLVDGGVIVNSSGTAKIQIVGGKLVLSEIPGAGTRAVRMVLKGVSVSRGVIEVTRNGKLVSTAINGATTRISLAGQARGLVTRW